MQDSRNGSNSTASATKVLPMPPSPAVFGSMDLLIEAALNMLRVRQMAATDDHSPASTSEGPASQQCEASVPGPSRLQVVQAWKDYFHTSIHLTHCDLYFTQVCTFGSLTPLEIEVLVTLFLVRLGLLPDEYSNCGGLLRYLQVPERDLLGGLRCLSEEGKLFTSKYIAYEDESVDFQHRKPILTPGMEEDLLHECRDRTSAWEVANDKELYNKLGAFTELLSRKSRLVDNLQYGLSNATKSRFHSMCRHGNRMLAALEETLQRHPELGLARLFADFKPGFSRGHKIILCALVARELHQLVSCHPLFTGRGLLRAITENPEDGLPAEPLKRYSPLIHYGYIQPAEGPDELLSDDAENIRELEFELTLKSLDILGLENSVRMLSTEDSRLREPKLELGQLVISDKVKRALDMAISQANHSSTLFERWGMDKVLIYGRAVTLLFSGPPGVGKTACAEALAHTLGRRLVVADYSRIQSCWVGQTEKNIVRTFMLAHKNQAVLFWDEADAMFYDRDAALRSWEVRDVNVLMQAIEKFDGVCILATNRKLSLDPALERRISIKVEFDRPDQEMRKSIWQKHVPAEMPLEEPVDWEALSRFELTGGEIKNAVLNTARLVLSRGPEAKVRMRDFLDAVALETENRWGRGKGSEIGFGKDS